MINYRNRNKGNVKKIERDQQFIIKQRKRELFNQ